MFYDQIKPNHKTEFEQLLEKLPKATTYAEWLNIAQELDTLRNMDQWKNDMKSPLYDFKLIISRLNSFKAARIAGDTPAMKLLIRSGLLRNLGGICDSRLHTNTFTGTKKLIDEYLNEVVQTIDYLMENGTQTANEKMVIFSEVEQSFGHTALLLHGGATFGLYHLGVVKALAESKLLPKIISGNSVGALIAALVCIHTEDELPKLFEQDGIDLEAFTSKSKRSISRKFKRLISTGHLLDVKVLEDCVRANLGDVTFEEAFRQTGKILNIVMASVNSRLPQTFNYLTTPNVLIRSAACGSASVFGLYDSVDLLAKDNDGRLFVWTPSTIKWESSFRNIESPANRLSELFNVNQFILSQAQPYIAPFLTISKNKNGMVEKIINFVSSEMSFRFQQLSKMGLLPRVDITIKGHVTIAPLLASMDFYTIFSNPTYSSLGYWIRKGEQSTWPFISIIRNRYCIERKLIEARERLKEELPDMTPPEVESPYKKRTKSIG